MNIYIPKSISLFIGLITIAFNSYAFNIVNLTNHIDLNSESIEPAHNQLVNLKDQCNFNKLAIELTINYTDVTCFGQSNGTAYANVTGGTAPYAFLWNTNSTTQQIDSLSPGIYVVTATDANNDFAIAQITISQPAAIVLIIPDTSLNCTNPQISLASMVTGGVGNFSFLWNTGETSSFITVNNPGIYSLIVKDSLNCQMSDTALVSIDTISPNLFIYPPNIISCSQPVIQINASSDPIANYVWSTNDGHFISGQNSLTPLVDKAGTYILKAIILSNGCSSFDSIKVIASSPVIGSAIVKNVSCYGDSTGAISVTATGGILPYRFIWSTGDTSSAISSLKVGYYTLIIRDNTTCRDTLTLEITQPEKLEALINKTPLSGPGKQDGTATVIPKGGVSPYSILWNTNENSLSIDSLSSGLYTVVLTDANGCSTSQSTYINPYNCTLLVSSSNIPVSCYGGSNGIACVGINGGTFPYTYQWNSGENTNCIQNQSAGIHTVTITDAVGCIEIKQIQIDQPTEITVSPSSIIITGETGKDFADGTVSLTANGGVPPYSYYFDNGTEGINLSAGNHSVSITDDKGCTKVIEITIPAYQCSLTDIKFVNFQFTPTCYDKPVKVCVNTVIGGIAPFKYLWANGTTDSCVTDLMSKINVVTITDAKNCPSKFFINYTPPDSLHLNVTIINANDGKTNGSLIVNTPIGGTSPYSYLWNCPNGFSTTTKDLINVPAGIYCLTITDANGCSKQACYEVKIKVSTQNLQDAGWKLYPNPSKDIIYLQKSSNIIGSLNWEILDNNGTVLLSGLETNPKESFAINISRLLSGNYFIVMIGQDGKRVVGRFVIRQ